MCVNFVSLVFLLFQHCEKMRKSDSSESLIIRSAAAILAKVIKGCFLLMFCFLASSFHFGLPMLLFCFYFNICFLLISGFLISYGYMVSQCKSSRCCWWTNRQLFIYRVLFSFAVEILPPLPKYSSVGWNCLNTRNCVYVQTVQHIEFSRVMHLQWVLQAISVCNGSLVTRQAFLFYSFINLHLRFTLHTHKKYTMSPKVISSFAVFSVNRWFWFSTMRCFPASLSDIWSNVLLFETHA